MRAQVENAKISKGRDGDNDEDRKDKYDNDGGSNENLNGQHLISFTDLIFFP